MPCPQGKACHEPRPQHLAVFSKTQGAGVRRQAKGPRRTQQAQAQMTNLALLLPRLKPLRRRRNEKGDVCVCVCVCIYAHTHTHTHMYMYIYTHTHICICIHTHMYACMYVCMYVCMYRRNEEEEKKTEETNEHVLAACCTTKRGREERGEVEQHTMELLQERRCCLPLLSLESRIFVLRKSSVFPECECFLRTVHSTLPSLGSGLYCRTRSWCSTALVFKKKQKMLLVNHVARTDKPAPSLI